MVIQDLRDRKGTKDSQVLRDHLELRGQPVPLDLLDRRETLGNKEILGVRDQTALKVLRVTWVLRDLLVHRVHLVYLGCLDLREQQVLWVRLDRRVVKDSPAQLGTLVTKAHREHLAIQVTKARKVQPDLLGLQVRQEHLEQLEPSARLAVKVVQANLDNQGLLGNQDRLVILETQALKGLLAQLELLVHLDQ